MNVLAVSRHIRRGAVAVALVCLSAPLFAGQVVPSDEATTRVIVRASASSQSVQVGCHNIRIVISPATTIQVSVWQEVD